MPAAREALSERRERRLCRKFGGAGWRRRRLRRVSAVWRRSRLRGVGGSSVATATLGGKKRPREEEEKVAKEEEEKAQEAPALKRRAILPPPEESRNGEEGEPSRTEVGLELLGELAPEGLDWSYPLADETWRCFAGYLPSAVPETERPRFFEAVNKGTKWLQPAGRWGPLPLRTAWMTSAPCCCKYRYGGAEVLPEPYPEWMYDIMAVAMPLCGLPKKEQWPNSCNLNLYVDGGHSVGWHSDNESLFQGKHKDCRIISLSLGQTRKFELRCQGAPMQKFDLGDGDLCTMEGLTQKYYLHRVPKEGGKILERINLTWRWVVEHTPACTSSSAATKAPAPATAAAAPVAAAAA